MRSAFSASARRAPAAALVRVDGPAPRANAAPPGLDAFMAGLPEGATPVGQSGAWVQREPAPGGAPGGPAGPLGGPSGPPMFPEPPELSGGLKQVTQGEMGTFFRFGVIDNALLVAMTLAGFSLEDKIAERVGAKGYGAVLGAAIGNAISDGVAAIPQGRKAAIGVTLGALAPVAPIAAAMALKRPLTGWTGKLVLGASVAMLGWAFWKRKSRKGVLAGDLGYGPGPAGPLDLAGELGGLRLSHPLPAGSFRVSSPYGYRTAPAGEHKGKRRMHNGVDFAAPTGTPVYAAAAGVVSKVWKDHAVNGNAVMITHADGRIRGTAYLHLSALNVKRGQVVRTGQLIGRVGSTGRSTGPHLHFMVYEGAWKPGDPEPHLRAATAEPEAERGERLSWSNAPRWAKIGVGLAAVAVGVGTVYTVLRRRKIAQMARNALAAAQISTADAG